MSALSQTRLQQVIDRFEEVEARMGAASDSAEIITLSKEHAELRPVVEKARALMSVRKGLSEAEAAKYVGAARQSLRAEKLIFSRWAQVMIRVEHGMYNNPDQDLAKIARREQFALIYIVQNPKGDIEKIILPIRGYGLWSTLHGFIALESDGNTVAGLGFYEHGETPGLGGNISVDWWKEKWIGKKVFDE